MHRNIIEDYLQKIFFIEGFAASHRGRDRCRSVTSSRRRVPELAWSSRQTTAATSEQKGLIMRELTAK